MKQENNWRKFVDSKIIKLVMLCSLLVTSVFLSGCITIPPTTPVISIQNNVILWEATGRGDITSGRFIRQYEIRVLIGNDTYTEIVDGPTELGVTMTKDLTTFNLNDAINSTANAEVSVRTIRNLDSGTRYSTWSNTVT